MGFSFGSKAYEITAEIGYEEKKYRKIPEMSVVSYN
jgi:hypothetical protein